ncbi:MAG: hypothetical protein GY757_03140, partial [bacterium]|nr:hypothetical protein [bacterium]
MRKYKFIGFIVILAAVLALGYLFLLKSIAPEAPGSHTSLEQNYHPDRDIQPYTNLCSSGVFNKKLYQRDLRKYGDTLKYCSFDTATPWPPKNKMPAGFSPEDIIETGKSHGLGIKSLHSQGITGKGIKVAIIDYTPRRN